MLRRVSGGGGGGLTGAPGGRWWQCHARSTALPRRWLSIERDQEAKKRQEFLDFVKALAQFHRQEGHFVAPFKTQIDGIPVGRKLAAYGRVIIQRGLKNPQIVEPLEAIGFPVHTWRQYLWQTAILPALETYKRLHGDLLVPKVYVVPYGDPQWPRPTWNYVLGNKVDEMRQNRDHLLATEDQLLVSMGFVWNVNRWRWHQRSLPALTAFKAKFGHVNVPRDFVVPREDESWPKELQGIKLGLVVHNIRGRDDFASVEGSRDQLKALGFDWNPLTTRWKERILPALETFHRLHGHCVIPYSFIVPRDVAWPRATWELKLGQVLQLIRSQGPLNKYIAEDQERWNRLGIQPYTKRAPSRGVGEKRSGKGSFNGSAFFS